ncbi:MAG: flippase-like domain-containing protein [Planctomycetes bacterium]|nr:flippase-like domain-containing protein [Planctomycetota bacterium]MCH9726060.1 flippase-like domain-containing protein [Planctomycetota bacterium]MCH9777212.1 flippase-like domain-containing protein [Planctomycetota bacterium]MCH9790495.1 flippase-like domain-containing protein [Planctomycetota bacterium]MDF1742326.1 hypothetical protein [Gimesia sp.]
MSDSQATPSSKPVPAWGWKLIKWALLVSVLYYVGRQGYQLYQEQREALTDIQIKPMWLILSGVCSVVAWLPSVWFWQRMMIESGDSPGFLPTARAYYCGHLGKYIPGKISVLLIRATLMKEFGVRVSVAALTAAYETLAVMGVGLVLFLALVPYVINVDQLAEWPAWIQSIQSRPVLVPTLILFVLFISLPFLSRLINLFSQKITKSDLDASKVENQSSISIQLLYVGVIAFLISWVLHGLSLGLIIASLGNSGLDWQEWPLWTAAISAAFALGFAALFAPAGLGVREGLIALILAGSPTIGPVNAFVAALLIRIVSFVSELLTAFVLYYCFSNRVQINHNSTQKNPETL